MAMAVFSVGCTPSSPPPAKAPGAPARINLPRTVITADRATSIPELYRHAKTLAAQAKHAEAAHEFERVVRLDAEGTYAADALFQSGAEYDAARMPENAALGYEQFARKYPRSELGVRALVRATRLWLFLEQWQRAGELAQRALSSGHELGTFESVVLYGASALARLSQDDEQAAHTFIEKGRDLIESHQLEAAGRIEVDLAPVYFALGELRRRHAERVVFVPLPANFGEVLEQRCQLLLDAQSAYSDVFRAYDAHWSAMAGYRVGELYERLHQDLMRVMPEAADTEDKRQLFEGAMRLRYSILLEKALAMMDHTLSMAEREGERSAWVDRARLARSEILQAKQREEAAMQALPYSRATLEAALADVQRKAQQKATAPPRKASGSK